MAEYKITDKCIRDIADICSDAREVMEKHFPDVFEEKEEWVDITEEIEYKIAGIVSHYITGIYDDEEILYVTHGGIRICEECNKYYTIYFDSDTSGWFKIFKKVVR